GSLLLEFEEAVRCNQRRELFAPLRRYFDRCIVEAIVPTTDAGPFFKRRIDPGELATTALKDFLSCNNPDDLWAAHVRSPMAEIIADRNLDRSFSGSWNQRCDDTRWITGMERLRIPGLHISRARADSRIG